MALGIGFFFWFKAFLDLLIFFEDPPEQDILQRLPRNPKQGILSWKNISVIVFQGLSMSLITLGVYLFAIYQRGYQVDVILMFDFYFVLFF